MKKKFLQRLRKFRLNRRAKFLERKIREVHADSLYQTGRMSLYQGELLPALSLELVNIYNQLNEIRSPSRPTLAQIHRPVPLKLIAAQNNVVLGKSQHFPVGHEAHIPTIDG